MIIIVAHSVSYDLTETKAMSIGFSLARRLHFGHVHGLRLRDRELLLGRDAVELEAARANRLDVLGPHVDQRHVLAVMREIAADVTAERAGADDCDAFTHNPCLPTLYVAAIAA